MSNGMKSKASRRTFRWKCWWDGRLVDIVVEPPAREEKNAALGGVPGRFYNRQGGQLKTTAGVVRQDGEGRTYFIPN